MTHWTGVYVARATVVVWSVCNDFGVPGWPGDIGPFISVTPQVLTMYQLASPGLIKT
jgi:hypothetical protein